MTPRQALELLAQAARQVMTIAQADHYNAAVKSLAALIDTADKPEPPKDA